MFSFERSEVSMPKRFLVTGGAGFIGSAVVRRLIEKSKHKVLVLDKLTYAGNLESLTTVAGNARYRFEQVDIVDTAALRRVFEEYSPDVVIHLAAESHVDRSIDGPAQFIQTNIVGTFSLLETSLSHWRALPSSRRADFRFHHVSTDEVFGSLGATGSFCEETAYRPNSPYAASKAASDHLVRAWHHTYGLPVVDHQLLQQLRPLSFPRKIDSAHDHKCVGGQAPAGVRHR